MYTQSFVKGLGREAILIIIFCQTGDFNISTSFEFINSLNLIMGEGEGVTVSLE